MRCRFRTHGLPPAASIAGALLAGGLACNTTPSADTDSAPALEPGLPIEVVVFRRANMLGEEIVAAGPIDPADGELVGLPQLDAWLYWRLSPAAPDGSRWFVTFDDWDSETLVFHKSYMGTTTLYVPTLMHLEGGVGLSEFLEKSLIWGESSGDLYAMHTSAFVHRIDVERQTVVSTQQLDYQRGLFWERHEKHPLSPDERWARGRDYDPYEVGRYHLFSVESGEEVQGTTFGGSEPRWIGSSDLYVIQNNQVAVLEAPAFSERHLRLPHPRNSVQGIDIAPNTERFVVAVGGPDDTCSTAFGYDDGEAWVQVSEVSATACVRATWSPDSRFAVLIEDGNAVHAYPQEPQGIRLLRGADGAIGTLFASGVASKVQWSPDGQSLSLTRCDRLEVNDAGEPPACVLELWTDVAWGPEQAEPSARLVRTFSSDTILQFAP